MSSTNSPPATYLRKGRPAAIVIALLFFLFAGFLAVGQGALNDARAAALNACTLIFSGFIIFMIFYTGRVDRWRRLFFSTYAVAFAVSFVWWTMGDRGHMWLLDREVLHAEAPMCHIVVPMLILPAIFRQEVTFPTSVAHAGFMILLVAVVSLVFGRAFCSWGCFFGGQDQLFSSMPKNKRWKLRTLPPFARYFSFGLLAFIVLHSAATMSPTYCFWFCPFKTSSEFIEVNSFIRVIQTFIFVALWFLLAVFLPFLSKKRIQCGLFCPMGAFLSCTSKFNLFGLKIDRSSCKECHRCVEACPTFSLTKESLAEGEPTISCSRCGACIESCPEGSIRFSTLGVPFVSGARPEASERARPGFWRNLGSDLWDPGVIFVFGIYLVATVMASGYLVDSTSRLLKYFVGI